MTSRHCPECATLIGEENLFCTFCGVTTALSRMECENHSGERAIGVCIVCGKPVCGDCSVTVQKSLFCDQPEHQTTQKEWAVIFTSESEFESDAIRRNLEFAGMETKVFSMRDHVATFWFDEFAIVRVMVRQSEKERALVVLEELQLLNGPAEHQTRNT